MHVNPATQRVGTSKACTAGHWGRASLQCALISRSNCATFTREAKLFPVFKQHHYSPETPAGRTAFIPQSSQGRSTTTRSIRLQQRPRNPCVRGSFEHVTPSGRWACSIWCSSPLTLGSPIYRPLVVIAISVS